ncbi:hypothetical protein CsSME_00035816 [Camellia sinensis var. sinensis]
MKLILRWGMRVGRQIFLALSGEWSLHHSGLPSWRPRPMAFQDFVTCHGGPRWWGRWQVGCRDGGG